jgi:Dyp-type peroxidase family
MAIINGPDFAAIAGSLQGNILKSHGRGHTSHIFFRFNTGKEAAARRFLKKYARTKLTTASQQQQVADARKAALANGQTVRETFFYGLLLSADGYRFLGLTPPDDPNFENGMKASNANLIDAPINTWDIGYQSVIHGMILVARGGDNRLQLDAETKRLITSLRLGGLATINCVEKGNGIKNTNGDDIEHFGYVDGISQPKFFTDEIDSLNANGVGTNDWNPAMPSDLVLVPENPAAADNLFGSYFVFRKLEQNVRAFKMAEQRLGTTLFGRNATPAQKELAGAMVVGRFENGMPVTLAQQDDDPVVLAAHGSHVGHINNFDYSADTDGAKCPFHSHIRKTNPRHESPFEGSAAERHHTMARRGIIYGDRFIHPNEVEIDEMPTKDVGLLFMSFQSNIANQFEFIQSTWANNPDFKEENVGKDGVIGQGAFANGLHKYARNYNNLPLTPTRGFGGFVTLKGGEYFFAPTMDFLTGLV